jgi:hypothetical protein
VARYLQFWEEVSTDRKPFDANGSLTYQEVFGWIDNQNRRNLRGSLKRRKELENRLPNKSTG